MLISIFAISTIVGLISGLKLKSYLKTLPVIEEPESYAPSLTRQMYENHLRNS